MFNRILRNTSVPALVLICAMGLAANAQAAKKTKKAKAKTATTETKALPAAPDTSASQVKEDTSSQGEILKFNTDSVPANTDRHEMMQFKDSGAAPIGSPRPEYAESAPEDAGYKAYLGYPKHQLGIYLNQVGVSSKWTSGEGYEYNLSSSTVGFGLNYKLMISPLWTTELDYQHFTLGIDDARVKFGGTTFHFAESTQSFDNYYIRNKFCVIGKSTFYQQLCPGVDVGMDGYPLVNYTSNTDLAMGRVQDLIVGVNLTYQIPAGQSLLFKIMGGYNQGTGIGNSGALTSKSNSSYFGDASLDWNVTEHNLINLGADYKARSAKVSGTVGPTQINWKTESGTLAARIGYARQF